MLQRDRNYDKEPNGNSRTEDFTSDIKNAVAGINGRIASLKSNSVS